VIRATDSGSNVSYRAFSIAVDPLTITTPAELPPGFTNTSYSHQLNYTGGSGAVVWELVGSMPSGFSLSNRGLITGSSSSPLNGSIVIKATDETGAMRYRTFFLTITNPIDLASVEFAAEDGLGGESAAWLR
jgi:hypothetical protein